MQADKEPILHIEKSCICGANIADRYIRAGASHAAASAMISHMGGSETDAVPKQSGTLWATTTGTHNDTPALDALKASCGAPISMGRGETGSHQPPVLLQREMQSRGACRQVLACMLDGFWLKLAESVHTGNGGGDAWTAKTSRRSVQRLMSSSASFPVQRPSRKW